MKYDKDNPLRVCTLFSGYDSQMMALRRLEERHTEFCVDLVAWCEIDKYACMAHDVVFPEYVGRNLGDICKVDWHDVPDFDLVTWSFPCQAISIAGKQEGLKKDSGTTSSLAYEALKCFEVKRPKYLLMENVSALLSAKFKKDWFDIRRRLEAMGYTNFFQVIDASDHGIPQHRERVFMVSILQDSATPPHYEFPKPYPLQHRLKDVLEPYGKVSEEYYLKPKQLEEIVTHCDKKQAQGCGFKPNFTDGEKVSGTILSKYGCRETDTYIKEQPSLFDVKDFQ